VETGWRQGGDRVETAWRERGGRVKSDWRQDADTKHGTAEMRP